MSTHQGWHQQHANMTIDGVSTYTSSHTPSSGRLLTTATSMDYPAPSPPLRGHTLLPACSLLFISERYSIWANKGRRVSELTRYGIYMCVSRSLSEKRSTRTWIDTRPQLTLINLRAYRKIEGDQDCRLAFWPIIELRVLWEWWSDYGFEIEY